MSQRRLTMDSSGVAVTRPVSLRALRLVLFAVAMLIANGLAQHWHAPVHLAEQMHSLPGHSDDERLDDHHCLTCQLLKLGQTGVTLAAVSLLPDQTVARFHATGEVAIDHRLPQRLARGPPSQNSTII